MLKYIKINYENIDYADDIQKNIFPKSSAYKDYVNANKKQANLQNYYVVYNNNTLIGITGYYYENENMYLKWFGVLKQFRNKGYGTDILNDTIKMSTKNNVKINQFIMVINNKDRSKLFFKKNIKDYKIDNENIIFILNIKKDPSK